jgi:hypothetical protein
MRRGEVAWTSTGVVRVGPPEDLAGELTARLAGAVPGADGRAQEVVLGGDGALRHAAEILAVCGDGARSRVHVAGPPYSTPSAAVLALIGVERVLAGEVVAQHEVLPMYLRDADAAIGWESRHGRVPAVPAVPAGAVPAVPAGAVPVPTVAATADSATGRA